MKVAVEGVSINFDVILKIPTIVQGIIGTIKVELAKHFDPKLGALHAKVIKVFGFVIFRNRNHGPSFEEV